ncbi:MAG: hypothetical protein R2788_17645 [Saprospiraceae bacterium]
MTEIFIDLYPLAIQLKPIAFLLDAKGKLIKTKVASDASFHLSDVR